MCDKQSYRDAGYNPRKPDELWEESPMNPERKKKKEKTHAIPITRRYSGIEFIEDTM